MLVGADRYWTYPRKQRGNEMVDWAIQTKEEGLQPWRAYLRQWLDGINPGSVRVYEGRRRERQYEIRGDGFSIDATLDRIEEESLPAPVSQSEIQLTIQAYPSPDCRGTGSSARTLVFAHPGSVEAAALMAEARQDPNQQPDPDLGSIRSAMVGGSEVVATLDIVRLFEAQQAYHRKSINMVQAAQAEIFASFISWQQEMIKQSRAVISLMIEGVQTSGDRELQRILAERQIEAEQQQRAAELDSKWKERLIVGGFHVAETAVKAGVLSQRGAENLAGAIADGIRAAAPSPASFDD